LNDRSDLDSLSVRPALRCDEQFAYSKNDMNLLFIRCYAAAHQRSKIIVLEIYYALVYE